MPQTTASACPPPNRARPSARVRAGALATLACAVTAAPAAGDEVAAVETSAEVIANAGGADNVQVFDPEFFARFNPVTALDMVNQVPGFTVDDGENRRGFGATAGNVLIDGERPSTKGGVSGELGRIAASRVARIELIRGGSGDSDVRGQATLVNVVLGDGGSSTTWVSQFGFNQGGRVHNYNQLTRSFRWLGANMRFDIRTPSGKARSRTHELLVSPLGELIERRHEFFQQNFNEVVLNATADWSPTPRDTVNLNLRGSSWRWKPLEFSHVVDDAGDFLRRDLSQPSETDTLFRETGADWERQLTPRSSVKLVALDSAWEWHFEQQFDSADADGLTRTTQLDSPGGRGERIGRATWTWKRNANQTFELGVESAFNYRDTNLSITFDDGGGGGPEPVDLPVAVTRVEELRGEAFATGVWRLSQALNLEAGFTFEASRITQTGDAEQEREFTYPKPRVIATYDMGENDQLRLSLERDVAQLDFGEFASSVSPTEDTVNRGNPNLEPERTWRARAEWERRFGERGAITLAGFYDAVESVQDLVVIDDFTGPGNLGDGVRWGASVEGSLPLDRMGLSNAQLKLETTVQTTEVDDPLTGEPRPFSDESDYFYSLDFRQDLPERRMAWGWDYQSNSRRYYFRADELQIYDNGEGDLDLFVETSRWGGVTLQFRVDNVFNLTETTERRFFDGLRGQGELEAIELRDRAWGPFYLVRLSGSF